MKTSRLSFTSKTDPSTASVGEKAQQFLPAVIENRLASEANRRYNPNYLVLCMARRTGLPLYPEWRSKFIHDYYAMQMLGVSFSKLTFRLCTMPGRGQIATKKFDHWDASTGTGYEFNTTPWSYMPAKRLKEKIE